MIEEIDSQNTQINRKRNRESLERKSFSAGKEYNNNEGEYYSEDEGKFNNRDSNPCPDPNKTHRLEMDFINASAKEKSKRLRLIEPFRTLGLVIDFNPLCYFKRNTERFVLASNFHSFLLYNLDRLRLERISPPLPLKITAFAAFKNKVFTAVGSKIYLWDKIHIIKSYADTLEEDTNIIYKKLIIFDKLLTAITESGELLIFDIYTSKLVKKLKLKADVLIHPATYLNKILFTKLKERHEEDLNLSTSKLYLYNINTEKQIFEFDLGIKSDIKVIEQSPVIDVVGIGLASGDIVIFNLKTLKKILAFKSDFPVESLSFSSCTGLNLSLLASGNPNGDINLWDLNRNCLHYTITNKMANLSFISSVMFLPNEPVLLVTSGKDNSIKMFKLESTTGTPSILKQRTGHTTHPHKIRFYGENANYESFHILSLSEKEIRNVSLLNEHMSKQFSMKNLPSSIKHEIVSSSDHTYLDFDFNEFRERDWSNIVTNVKGCSNPLLLSYENSRVDDTLAVIKSKSNCTAVCISMCGNFGFAGFEDGSFEKFNMQSGLNRWTVEKAHDKAIVKVKTDGINSMIISASLDSSIKFWDFFQASLLKQIQLPSVPQLLEISRDNDLVAVSMINSDIHIYDKSTFKLVREFAQNSKNDKNPKTNAAKINDMTFSRDGKWLISASEDKSLKIFDILSGNLIEWVKFKHIPLSVSISPNGQYLALSFVGLKGIYLWLNRSLFVDLVDLEDVKEPLVFDLPFNTTIKSLKTRKELYEEEKEKEDAMNVDADDGKKKKVKALLITNKENNKLIQLSQENKLKFRIINHLEKIQERNEPKIKKKEKTKAPFFLFNINTTQENDSSPEFMNILKNYSHFKNEKMVEKKGDQKDLILTDLLSSFRGGKVKSSEISTFLNSLNPYLIDLEIRNLDPMLSDNTYSLEQFLDYIHAEITSKTNFELVQAYMNRFLKVCIFYENLFYNTCI